MIKKTLLTWTISWNKNVFKQEGTNLEGYIEYDEGVPSDKFFQLSPQICGDEAEDGGDVERHFILRRNLVSLFGEAMIALPAAFCDVLCLQQSPESTSGLGRFSIKILNL